MNYGISRKNFLIGLGSALAVRNAAFAGSPKLGRYYAPYLDGIARKVADNAAKGAKNGFMFFTDPHVTRNFGQSGFIMADLVKRTGIRRVIGGGDYMPAFCESPDENPKDCVDAAYAMMTSRWRDPIEAAGGLFFTAKGNHDIYVWGDAKRSRGFKYASATARKMMMDMKACGSVTVNPEEKHGVYFYCDDGLQKTRYIVADTSDGVLAKDDSSGRGGGYGNSMRPAQLKWMGEVAFGTVPAGYSVVVVHHIPLTPFTGNAKEIKAYSDFLNILEAYQSHGKAKTAKAGEFDFSSRKGGDILFDIAGHTHSDRFAFHNGILHITEICDARNTEAMFRTPFSGKLFDIKNAGARKGTVKEQGFDVVNFGGGSVRTTRIGIGQDRVFRLKTVTLKAGSKAKLESAEFADVKWRGFDSWEVKENRKEKDPAKHWTFANKIADISPEGVVSAKSPGWATAVAIAPDFRKEIVGIKVEA